MSKTKTKLTPAQVIALHECHQAQCGIYMINGYKPRAKLLELNFIEEIKSGSSVFRITNAGEKWLLANT